ncbi:MAG TPA: hypothetical protein VFD62_14765 [Pyrinomonadaceae bacterium]|nr:hypothetical protein [Pyrinomonadaceae bacterium]
MRSRSAFLILAVLLLTSAAYAQQPAPAQPGTFEARVEEFLRQSGHEYRKVQANSWFLTVKGKEMGEIRIILGAGPSQIAMGAVVVPKQKLQLSTDALQKLMKLSYDLNYVRICIDSDDDLIVMAQLKDPWLNANEFRTTIGLVSSAADRAYAVMRPYLSKP